MEAFTITVRVLELHYERGLACGHFILACVHSCSGCLLSRCNHTSRGPDFPNTSLTIVQIFKRLFLECHYLVNGLAGITNKLLIIDISVVLLCALKIVLFES